MRRKLLIITVCLLIPFSLSGCFQDMTNTQKGAAVGAAAGAIGGQIIGGSTSATLIGAGVGALGGALINDARHNSN